MYFSPLPCHLVPLRPKYSPQHPTLKHPQPTFLKVRDQVSHPYKTTGKIIVLYMCISKGWYYPIFTPELGTIFTEEMKAEYWFVGKS
jgi:hypothetical protein